MSGSTFHGSTITTSGTSSPNASSASSIEAASRTRAPSNASWSTDRTPALTTGWSSTIKQRGGSFAPLGIGRSIPSIAVPFTEAEYGATPLLGTPRSGARQPSQNFLSKTCADLDSGAHGLCRGARGVGHGVASGGRARRGGGGIGHGLRPSARRRGRRARFAGRGFAAPPSAASARASGALRARGGLLGRVRGTPGLAACAASRVCPRHAWSLRRPGRDRGRFPSTPLSSLIGAQSRVTGSNGPSPRSGAETGAGCNVTGYVYPLGGFGVEPTWLTG